MSNLTEKKTISIVIPVFNEEENIPNAYDRVLSVVEQYKDKYNTEILFTDNHSSDNTNDLLTEIAAKNNSVKVIRFSKNFGYQQSILAGYVYSSGDAVVQLDCDMQDPPELILDFINYWEEGYEIVYGIRKSRKENFVINNIRKLFYKLIQTLSNDNLPMNAGDFRLIDKKIVEILRDLDKNKIYLRGLIASFGFKQKGIEYDRERRKKGLSNFKLADLFGLAFDGILNHSMLPLRLASIVGILISLITIFGSLGYLIIKVYYPNTWPPGFATTTILILISISLNGLFLGIIGEYIGRIYNILKKRPNVIIEKKLNI